MTRHDGAVGRDPVVRVAAPLRDGAGDRVAAAARDAGGVPVVRTGPTGAAAVEPLVAATAGGRTALFPAAAPASAREVMGAMADGDLPTETAAAVVDHDPETTTFPVPGTGPLAVGRRATLGPCGWIDPLAPADLSLVSPEEEATAAGLLGRGRGDASADEPVAETWATASKTDGDPVVVVNANETRPEQRADRTLLTGAPIAVLDGVAAVAQRVDATDAIVYLNGADDRLGRHVREAVETAADDLPVVPQVVAGPDEYRAGAPTAALEALEGADRIEPRRQPPTPAEYGLYGRPTVVHTPRTFAQVRRATHDTAALDADASDPGTRLVTVTGDVAAPATVELPSGGSLAAVREAVELDGSFKMACVGGILGGITRDLDVAPTAGSLRAAGLGTDGVVELLNDERCALADVGERAKFAASENSGRCVPGREGTKQLTELLRDVYDGDLAAGKIRELGRTMARSSNCDIGAHAPRPVTTAIDAFEPEFRAHADGRCPAGTCDQL